VTAIGGAGSPGASIVFLTRSLDVGGAERQMIGLAAGLHRAGWRVRVLTFYDGGTLTSDLIGQGVAVESLHKRGRWDVVGFGLRLVRQLRRDRPDIVHGYLVTPNVVSAIVKAFVGRPRVVWGVRASNMEFGRYGRLSSVLFAMSCGLSRFADLIICNSNAGKDFHASRGYPRSRMVVVPNGIDSTRFRPDAVARQSIRAEWGVTEGEVLVGLVARLDPMKDHVTFLHGAALVAADRKDARFVCVGQGPAPYGDMLERLATDLGLDARLIWAGERTDLPAVYNALDLAVSSSTYGEGFSNVVAEAMATGVPCVVTDVGDSRFIVGDAGWVCRRSSPSDLAGAIASALSSATRLAEFGDRARRRVTTEFSEDRREQATAEHLAGLLESD
jgi:glycosyltransferase involved in cell wall biosynthesis